MALDPDDTLAVLDAANLLVATPVPDFADVLALLRRLVHCTSASFNDLAWATGDFRYVMVPVPDEALMARLKPAFDRNMHEHPLIDDLGGPIGHGAQRFCDADDDIIGTTLYREFYRPMGVRYQMVMSLPSPSDVTVGYALNRSPDEGEFSDRDVEVLNSLEGHLAMHHRMVLHDDRSRAMAAEADRDRWAVVTVRSDGVIEATSSAELSSPLRAGERMPEEVVALLLGTDGIDEDDAAATSHDVVIGGDIWRCVVHPVVCGPTVVAVRRIEPTELDTAPLRDLGLTQRQAEIAIALAESGGTNAQLGRSLDVAEGTVKKHLESVFRSLGVDSRTAAVVALRRLLG
ncbi:MAG: helix-turn-helix transcriptional regulator [Acidimicrobiales bacterium]